MSSSHSTQKTNSLLSFLTRWTDNQDGSSYADFETKEPNVYRRVSILPDTDPLNPRQEYDNICTMLCWHSRYKLGDNYYLRSPLSKVSSHKWESWPDVYKNVDAVLGKAKAFLDEDYPFGDYDERLGPGIVAPLYLYDHSGLTISTSPFSCPWDSGQIGWIHCSYEKANRELLAKPLKHPARSTRLRQRMQACIDAEVATYDAYLRGDVWGYEIALVEKDEQGDFLVIEELDSCWGFYGHDVVKEEALSSLKALVSTQKT